MATLVCFHAHPDDEAIATGGTMARAAADGHRVVLVTATRGDHGEVPDGFLDEGESLAERREKELADAARILGAVRVAHLGYLDSGMMGTPENSAPGSFWSADVDEAAALLAAILEEERADVLTTYDHHGIYGHPDHIQVHRVAVRAAEMVEVPRVYEATVNRDEFVAMIEENRARGDLPDMPDTEGVDATMGMPASAITTTVDVSDQLDTKRRAMAAHPSQIGETSFFLSMPWEDFRRAFGTECYILRGAPVGLAETSLFDGLG